MGRHIASSHRVFTSFCKSHCINSKGQCCEILGSVEYGRLLPGSLWIRTAVFFLRRFKRTELLAKEYPYVALFIDQLCDDHVFSRTLGTDPQRWRHDISTFAAKQACQRLGLGIADWGVPPPQWESIPPDVTILVAGSFYMPSLDRRGRVCPYACWAEGLLQKLGCKFLSVSADMFKKIDSLDQRWFKKIDPKAKSTPVARVNGQWLFDSKDIVKAILDMQPRHLQDQIVIPSRPGVDPLVGPHGKELQTYCTIKWCAAPHGSKQEADMKAKTDEPLVIYENYLRAFGTPFSPGISLVTTISDLVTLRNFKWFGRWCKGHHYFEDFPLLSATVIAGNRQGNALLWVPPTRLT